ncbi:MAG: 4Fe-4S binding protein [Eubacteriales bacterium]|nr:4Fe-4S binding protein [Eubacteriales bacterium]
MAVDYATLKKGGFMRQKQKNNFSLRLAVVGGHLTAENLAKVAEVAEKYGDGHVHLTSRQSLEIPFIKLEDIDAVKAALAEGDVRPGVCGPRVRTVTACQGNQICPSGNIDSYDIAKKLDARYYAKELPHKFKFGVTGCQNNCLKTEENDVGVKGGVNVAWKEETCIGCGLCKKVCRENAVTITDGKVSVDYDKCNHCGRCVKSCPTDAWDAKEVFLVSFGGLFGNKINKGTEYLPPVTSEEQLFRVTDAALDFFREHANAGERFKFTIDRIGEEKFIKVIEEAYNG